MFSKSLDIKYCMKKLFSTIYSAEVFKNETFVS